MEKVRFLEGKGAHLFLLCSSDMGKVAKFSVPWFSHMWKTHQSLQDFKDYHSKSVTVCRNLDKKYQNLCQNHSLFLNIQSTTITAQLIFCLVIEKMVFINKGAQASNWIGIWGSYLLQFSFICAGFYFEVWLQSLYLHCWVVLTVCRFIGFSEITHQRKQQTVAIHILKLCFISFLMYSVIARPPEEM